MSDYLDQTPRTEQEALKDIHNRCRAASRKINKLSQEMQTIAEEINQIDNTKCQCDD